MTRTITRRDAIRAGGVGAATLLAGCSATSGIDGSAGPDGDATEPPAADGAGSDAGGAASGSTGGDSGAQPGPESIGAVTEVMLRTPLEVQVQRAEQVDTVDTFGLQLAPEEGNVAYAVTLALRNASDAYLVFATEGFAMLADDEQIVDVDSFADFTSDAFGGVPLAPGEVARYDLSFEVPEGASRYGVGGQFKVKVLPGTEFASLAPVLVDFATDAGDEPLTQQFAVPFRSFGDAVGAAGVTVEVREVSFAAEAGRAVPLEDHEFGIVDVRIENASAFRIAAGFEAGGFEFLDQHGRSYSSTRRAEGSVGDREILRLTNGLNQGEAAEGLIVAAVPQGEEPLYLSYSPPPVLYARSDTVAENRFLWEIR